MAIRIRRSRYGVKRPPKTNSRFRVGMTRAQALKLRRPPKGQFGATSSDRPLTPEAYRWKSVRGSHVDMLDSQLRKMEQEFTRFLGHLTDQSAQVVAAAFQPTFELSRVYCPKDTYELVNSGELVVVERMKSGTRGPTTVEIQYGRTGRPYYAVFVHEIMWYRHDPPTSAKFLERALKEDMNNVLDRLRTNGVKVLGT